jgi:mono/diheme cytochrome c family protein
MRGLLSAFSSFAGVLLLALAGCNALPSSKPASQWTPEEARGAKVFAQKCARCHLPTTTRTLKGPGLQAITKIGAPPFGAPLSDERITQLIQHGRRAMPAAQVNDGEMRDLLAYLHTL